MIELEESALAAARAICAAERALFAVAGMDRAPDVVRDVPSIRLVKLAAGRSAVGRSAAGTRPASHRKPVPFELGEQRIQGTVDQLREVT